MINKAHHVSMCWCTRRPPPSYVQMQNLITNFTLQFRYANNSNYKNDTMIRKEGFIAQEILDELKRIIEDSEVQHIAPTCNGLLLAASTSLLMNVSRSITNGAEEASIMLKPELPIIKSTATHVEYSLCELAS